MRWFSVAALAVAAAACTSPNPDYQPPAQQGGPGASSPKPSARDTTVDGGKPDKDCPTVFADTDGDGWGDGQTPLRICGDRPAGYVERGGDCDDDDARVFPGQTRASQQPRGDGTYDFNCDGKSTPVDVEPVNDCQRKEGRCVGGGWLKPLPTCGHSGKRMTCAVVGYESGLPICKASYSSERPACL